ncbi:redoxin domain-containing protein [Chryseolinea lacunae]|uniref:Redoxin domain-containing protein n=1 Tax=Chryseolinea lacunae TaxID=2801331 RepID=A0ABS1KUY8_9BACT|nr:redoxin domain-containing protein [Chryseolinea lacunae]MBL0743229.1 redoxin domain-containing protein [Chryseolinea lacunae]
MKTGVLVAFLFCAIPAVMAQQVPDFTLTNVVNGNTVSLSTYPSCSGVVIVFTTNTCAYDDYYRGRINKLSKELQDKVPVLLVNSSVDAPESVDNMTKKAQQWGLSAPYLADKDQVVMRALGATKSPQVYLLKNSGGKFTVVYSGAIDDNAQVEADVRHAYLKDAIDIMLTNQTIATPEVRPVGCTIRKK